MAGIHREVGDTIGGYRVLARLGTGGSGSVYKVEDESGGVAALKLVDARDDEVAGSRLAREVRSLQSLRHPAVPHILDAELEDDEKFVVFEFVPGETLFDYIQGKGPLSGDALADFAERTASALEAVHAAGVIHRDVTPSNVMMGPDGPVLIDFGLAHREQDDRLTREGLVSGTPGYVAPEVIDGAEPGTQADRWSWAATLAYAMTAQAPFGSGTGAISRTLEADVRLPEVAGADVLRAALGRDLAARPGMRDVVAALRGATEVIHAGLAPTAVAPVGLMPAQDAAPVPAPAPAPTAVMPSGEQPVDDAGGWDEPAAVEEWDETSDAWDEAPDERPAPPRRRVLLALAALVVIVAAPLAPVIAFLVMVGVAILARGVYRRAVAIEAARAKRGAPKTSDLVVHSLGLPWHTLRAAVECVPAILTAAALGTGTAAGAWWLIDAGAFGPLVGTDLYYAHAGAISFGALVAVITMAFGPYMSGTREGAHRMAAAVSPTTGLKAAWVLVAITAILVALIAIYVGPEDTWWWPVPDPTVSA